MNQSLKCLNSRQQCGYKQINNGLLGYSFSLIEHPVSLIRFIILDCPTESTLDTYLDGLVYYNVSTVVRCCPPTYSTEKLTENGISVVNLPFKDGSAPPERIINEWITIIDEARRNLLDKNDKYVTIAVHCIAGLGRAPVMVAIALIEMGVGELEAIEYIRERRRGAFNKQQLLFLDKYKRKLKNKQCVSLRVSLGRMLRLGLKSWSL